MLAFVLLFYFNFLWGWGDIMVHTTSNGLGSFPGSEFVWPVLLWVSTQPHEIGVRDLWSKGGLHLCVMWQITSIALSATIIIKSTSRGRYQHNAHTFNTSKDLNVYTRITHAIIFFCVWLGFIILKCLFFLISNGFFNMHYGPLLLVVHPYSRRLGVWFTSLDGNGQWESGIWWLSVESPTCFICSS